MPLISLLLLIMIASASHCQSPNERDIKWPEDIQVIFDNTLPLEYDLGDRLPLYLWPAIDPGEFDDETAVILVRELGLRGIGLLSKWDWEDPEKSLEKGIVIGKAQKKLGKRINIDAFSLLYSFYDNTEKTAHIDAKGNAFFDDSFGSRYNKMGCPFTLDFRKDSIRERLEYFLERYRQEGLHVDFIYADWEIDGPIEVNTAFESSLKCSRCLSHLGEDIGFDEFQKTMREMRSYLQYYAYSEPVLYYFPDALVGNYAVYPNDGYRYWYDYFEFFVDTHPHKTDQRAKYRKWYNDFPLTGYTFAMPVVYTWWKIFTWYDFENFDYRWFYNMLLNASNAGKNTPSGIPVISFVHWNTVFAGSEPDPAIVQMSEQAYQELLWHMLLRGTNTFFMWGLKNQYPEEVRLLHEVWAAAQEYGDFLDKGWPITFDVPDKPGVVISGLATGDRVLIRRTDFGEDHLPIEIRVGINPVMVEYAPGKCVIYEF